MKSSKAISVIMPSRKRFNILLRCLNNLIDTANNVENFEVLLRFDSDDIESIRRMHELPFDKVDIYAVIGNRFEGYADLHIYINELCSLSRGTFLFLYNDDATISTKGWDSIITREKNVVALNPVSDSEKIKYDLFPIIHRKIYDLFGFFSLSPHNDSWIFELTKTAGLEKKLPEFKIRHYRSESKDETHKDKVSRLTNSGKKHRSALMDDRPDAIKKLLEAKKEWFK